MYFYWRIGLMGLIAPSTVCLHGTGGCARLAEMANERELEWPDAWGVYYVI